MDCLHRLAVCLRGHVLRRSLPRLCVLLFAGKFCVAGAAVQAAPVVYQFEATISNVEGDPAPLNLPFSIAVGQQIAGKFTFQSDEDLLDIFLHHERGKQGLVTLSIDGMVLEALMNFGTLNDGGPVDINGPAPAPNSSLSLGYISPTDAIPGWGGRTGVNHAWAAGLVFVGTEGTISGPEDVLDIDAWNQLTTLRRFGLQLGFPDTVLVQATVGDFVGVPEPSMLGSCGQ